MHCFFISNNAQYPFGIIRFWYTLYYCINHSHLTCYDSEQSQAYTAEDPAEDPAINPQPSNHRTFRHL